MKRILGKVIMIYIAWLGLIMIQACSNSQERGESNALPSLVTLTEEMTKKLASQRGFEEGVSGAFAGQLGEWLIWGGGCNFPSDDPTTKRFYKSLFAIRATEEGGYQLIELPSLVHPCGYGASLLSSDGRSLYFIGGTDGALARQEIYEVTLWEGRPEVQRLGTSLPFGWYEGGAEIVGNQLYLAGGWRGGEEGNAPLLQLTRVSLTNGESSDLLPLTEGARIQPVLFVARSNLYLYGGFRPSTSDEPPHLHERGHAVSLDAETLEWREVAGRPTVALSEGTRPLLFVGSAVTRDPKSGEVYIAGGVDWEIFGGALMREYHEGLARSERTPDPETLAQFDLARQEYLSKAPEAYHFMPALLRFVPESETWEVVTENKAFATAGAALSAGEKAIYLAGGELKPRLRTPNIWRLER